MRARRLAAFRLRVPMRTAFEHAATARDSTDNVIVELELDDGVVGYGEAVPRRHVTGEDVASVLASLEGLPWGAFGAEVSGFEAGAELAAQAAGAIRDPAGKLANAARAALEVALLDAFGRATGTPIGPWLARRCGHAAPPDSPHLAYSGVLGRSMLGDAARLEALRDEFRYRALKMKVGFGRDLDIVHLRRVREVFGPEVEVRVDANRAWNPDEAESFLVDAAGLGVRAAEDPVRGETLDEMFLPLRRLRQRTGCQVILDEPVRTLDQAVRAVQAGAADAVSVRVSKCGGLSRSAEIASACQRLGAQVQLGCQVGESAILSAAGRQLAAAFGRMRWLEGSNERLKFAPENALTDEDLTYGDFGIGPPLGGPGLGIRVSRRRLDRLAERCFERRP